MRWFKYINSYLINTTKICNIIYVINNISSTNRLISKCLIWDDLIIEERFNNDT